MASVACSSAASAQTAALSGNEIYVRALATWSAQPTPAVSSYRVDAKLTHRGREEREQIVLRTADRRAIVAKLAVEGDGTERIARVAFERPRFDPDATFRLVARPPVYELKLTPRLPGRSTWVRSPIAAMAMSSTVSSIRRPTFRRIVSNARVTRATRIARREQGSSRKDRGEYENATRFWVALSFYHAHGGIRTPGLSLRRAARYPATLRARG